MRGKGTGVEGSSKSSISGSSWSFVRPRGSSCSSRIECSSFGKTRWRRSAGFFQTAKEPPIFRLPTVGKWKIQPGSVRSQALLWFNEGLAIFKKPTGMYEARAAPEIWLHQVALGTREALLREMTGWEFGK